MKFRVEYWEYERGWGSKIEWVEDLDTYEQAIKYRDEFNSRNTKKEVPDWYMVAKGPYEIKE